MRIDKSKEFWMAKARAEGDTAVGAGAPMRRETDCPHEAWEEIGGGRKCADCREWLPPLPSTEKPDDGKPPHDYVPCGLDCGCSDPHCHYVCGVEDGLILYCGEGKDDLVQHPRTEKPEEARDECRYTSYNARRCYVHGRERNLCDGPPVASPPPQAQPEETGERECDAHCYDAGDSGFRAGLETAARWCESRKAFYSEFYAKSIRALAPPPAQQGEPKRIGGRARMEVWELVGEIRHAESDKERERLCEDFDGWLAAVFGDRA